MTNGKIMKIALRTTKNGYIFDINSKFLTLELLLELENSIRKIDDKVPIALNFENVNALGNEFFEFVNKMSETRKISIINLQSDIFVLFNLTCFDQYLKIFLTDFDFENNKRMLINRRLSLVD